MKSKISCFNRTIFKKNFTLYWPLWIGYLLLLLAIVPLNLFQYMHISENQAEEQYSALRNVFYAATSPTLLFVFSTAAVLCVFSYLYHAKNTNGIHGFPVTRQELFVTNAFSAFIFLVIPELISFVAGVFVGLSNGVTRIEILLYLFLFQLGMTFFYTASASAIAMLTGNMIAMPVYCLIANYLYVIVREVLEELIIYMTYGLVDLWGTDISYMLSPLYYLEYCVSAETKYNDVLEQIDAITVSGGGAIAVYAGAGVLLFVIAYRLYRRRQLETAGDIISVKAMKPVFRIGLGVCGGTAVGYLLSDLLHFDTERYSTARFSILLCFVISGIFIGFFVAEMLMQKSFRVFRKQIIAEAVVSAGAVGIFLAAVNADAFGLEHRIPASEEIAEAWVDCDYPIQYKEEELAELLAVHSQILEEKEGNIAETAKNDVVCRNAVIKYVLTDGSILVRKYLLPVEQDALFWADTPIGKLLAKEMEAENMKQYMLGTNYESNQYLSGYIDLYDEYQNCLEYRFGEEELAVISKAVLKDVEEGNILCYEFELLNMGEERTAFRNSLRMRFYNEDGILRSSDTYYNIPMYYNKMSGGGYFGTVQTNDTVAEVTFDGKVDSETVYISFGTKSKNLIAALEELGIINDTWKLYTVEEYYALES